MWPAEGVFLRLLNLDSASAKWTRSSAHQKQHQMAGNRGFSKLLTSQKTYGYQNPNSKVREQKRSLWHSTQAPVPVDPYHPCNLEANYTMSLSFTFPVYKMSKSCHFFAHRTSSRALLETEHSHWLRKHCGLARVTDVSLQCTLSNSLMATGHWPYPLCWSHTQPTHPWTSCPLILFRSEYHLPSTEHCNTVLCINSQTSIWGFFICILRFC